MYLRFFSWVLILLLGGTLATRADLTHRFQARGSEIVDNVGGLIPLQPPPTPAFASSEEIPPGAPPGTLSILFETDAQKNFTGFGLPPAVLSPDKGTISVWIKPSQLPTSGFKFVFSADPTNLDGCALFLDPNSNLIFELGGKMTTATNLSTLNTWYQVTVVYDRSTEGREFDARLYLNGVEVANLPPDRKASLAPPFFTVGNWGLSGDGSSYVPNRFAGLMYELQFYNNVLTAAQVHDLYQNPGTAASDSP